VRFTPATASDNFFDDEVFRPGEKSMTGSPPGPRRPGGQLASRPLHFIWLIDGSGSMAVQGRMDALNSAIRAAVPHMQSVARENPQAAVFVNAIRFGDEARWMVERLTPVSEFRWPGVEARGGTAMGEAVAMAGDALQPPLIWGRALPPLLVLVTDGLPTDDFRAGMSHLLSKAWGRRAARFAIALGEEAAGPEAQAVLRAFVSKDSPPPLLARDPEALAGHVRWVSTAALRAVCSPLAYRPATALQNGDLPVPALASSTPESEPW
jgi:uncharacterized protein YegL